MSITLFHHPWSRASGAVWILEELGLEYSLEFVDLRQERPARLLALNPMGKLPTLALGDDVVLTEAAAIGMYLADRYSLGELAPALDDPARAPYLRWIAFAPAVIEPCAYAHRSGWEYSPGSAGWGTWEAMHSTLEHAIGAGPWLLGERFSMADVTFGSTVRFLRQFDMLEPRPAIEAYVARLVARPAYQRADEVNKRVVEERGLGG